MCVFYWQRINDYAFAMLEITLFIYIKFAYMYSCLYLPSASLLDLHGNAVKNNTLSIHAAYRFLRLEKVIWNEITNCSSKMYKHLTHFLTIEKEPIINLSSAKHA
jgi:hypothetical protein